MASADKDKWNPDQYHRFQKERAQPFHDLVAMIEPRDRMTVADLGCGTGELTLILHQHLKAEKTVGLDSSEAMLKKANALKSPELSFRLEAIENFHPEPQYDLLFSNAALQWCPDHEKLFAALTRALKPVGQLAIQMPANHDYPTHVIADKIANEEPWKSRLKGYRRDVPVFSPEKYAQMLFDLGYTRQEVRLRVYTHLLDSREDVVEWVKGTLLTAFESRLSPDHFGEFLAEFKSRLFRELADAKPFFYSFKRILIWGKL